MADSLHGERQLRARTLEDASNTYDKQLLSRIGGPSGLIGGPGGANTPKRQSLSYAASGNSSRFSPQDNSCSNNDNKHNNNNNNTAAIANSNSAITNNTIISSSSSRSRQVSESERRSSQLRPLSMPEERRQTLLDSPASSRWPGSPAVSPAFSAQPFWAEHGPPEGICLSRNQAPYASGPLLHYDDGQSCARGGGGGSSSSNNTNNTTTTTTTATTNSNTNSSSSYDNSAVFMQDEFMDDGRIGGLNLHDRSPGSDEYRADARASGVKRRASSPPREALRDDRISISSASGQSEILQRRSIHPLSSRASPVSRFHPNHSSLSSVSSLGLRNGSLGSSLGLASISTSATSYASGRMSPAGLSPAFEPETRSEASQSSTALPMKYPPAMSGPQHSRAYSTASQSGAPSVSAEGSIHSRNSSISQVSGPSGAIYICECCPKKPKKFDSREELRLHESEKQYTCMYCPNRFKNKNEAERHQNSLHLRRHSWSCAALAGVEAAFHPSPTDNADVCGYCGDEFPNPPQWDMRAEHLNHVHKFGECNQTKKFFRADHFRQHLKHSHSGTSGKWTNQLENACQRDEPLPEKRVVMGTMQHAQPLPALVVPDIATSQYGNHGSIRERPRDS